MNYSGDVPKLYPECTACKSKKVPYEHMVQDTNGVKYCIAICPKCKTQDIQRYSDMPNPKLWTGTEFVEGAHQPKFYNDSPL